MKNRDAIWISFIGVFCLSLPANGQAVPKPDSEPLSSEAALKILHLPEGFRAEIVAAEPETIDPVAFDWDTKGRLWVVEMADYPLGLDGEGQSGGRVRVLEDRDDDGKFEKSSLFAEGLNFPNGLITWRDGVIVTAAPDILYLRDSNGDGTADIREVLYTGLLEGNQQLRANGLRWGLDGWIYVAAGGHHGKYGTETKVRSSRAGKEVVIGSRDFRIRPDNGEIEPESGPTQFGRNRDDWGHWFGTQNSKPLWHYVFPDRYLRRNPHFAAPGGQVQLPGTPSTPVFPASPFEKRYHNFAQSGRFTSACGGMIFQDDRLFGDGGIHAFTCEPFHNLVQGFLLKESGATFAAERWGGEKDTDFFASEDRWCRPVMGRTGPDGALWIADMYRYMIEHPQWLPKEGKEELLPHYRLGDDRGRIYRISKSGETRLPIPKLDSMTDEEIAAQLESPNGWIRDKAQQLLIWRKPSGVVPSLERIASTSSRATGRVQGLWTLEALGGLTPPFISKALADPHPGVRENALQIAEFHPETEVAGMIEDADAKVRLQLAFTLGEFDGPEAGAALGQLLIKDAEDEFIQAAALTSVLPHLDAVVKVVGPETSEKLKASLVEIALGVGHRSVLAELIGPVVEMSEDGSLPDHQIRQLIGLIDNLSRQKSSLKALREAAVDDTLGKRLSDVEKVFQSALEIARDQKQPSARRISAAALLARAPEHRDSAIEMLSTWLSPATSRSDFANALAALSATGDARVPDRFFAAWPELSPESRGLVLDRLFERGPWTNQLLERIGTGPDKVRIADFDATRRMRLVNHANAGVKARAAKIFETASSPSRSEVVEKNRAALKLAGDADRGHLIYQQVCAACHRHGDEGIDIGPDLQTVAAHEPEKILSNILDPNLDIQPGYHAYSCTVTGGEQLFGIISSENASSLTLKLPDGSTRSILRKDIASLRSADISLMPEGLEGVLAHQQLADLIAFLRKPGN